MLQGAIVPCVPGFRAEVGGWMLASLSWEVPGLHRDPGLLGSPELLRAREPADGCCQAAWWGHGHPQPLPRRTAPWGEDAPALHPSGLSKKAGEGLHGL